MGAIAGAFGGRVDAVLMRVTDVLLVVPGICSRSPSSSPWTVACPRSCSRSRSLSWIFARDLRGSMLSLHSADYVMAARAIGATRGRLLFRHFLRTR